MAIPNQFVLNAVNTKLDIPRQTRYIHNEGPGLVELHDQADDGGRSIIIRPGHGIEIQRDHADEIRARNEDDTLIVKLVHAGGSEATVWYSSFIIAKPMPSHSGSNGMAHFLSNQTVLVASETKVPIGVVIMKPPFKRPNASGVYENPDAFTAEAEETPRNIEAAFDRLYFSYRRVFGSGAGTLIGRIWYGDRYDPALAVDANGNNLVSVDSFTISANTWSGKSTSRYMSRLAVITVENGGANPGTYQINGWAVTFNGTG